MHIRFLALLAVLASPLCSLATPQDAATPKSDLRVLFVGDDPEAPKVVFASAAKPRTVELYKERTAAFTALLEEHFASVTVVHGDDYVATLSKDVDVTVFDTRPKALSAASREIDPATGEMSYQPARYIPESFDKPALMISANSPLLGEPLGLKLDWL